MRILFAGALLCSLSLAGCDALDTKEDLNLTDEMMATRRYQMFGWGYRVYEHIPYGFTAIDGNLFAAVSDEAQYVTTFSSTQRFNEGSWSAYYNPDDCYTSYYNGIYAAHDYLDKSVDYRYILGMHRDTLTSNGLDSYRRDIVDVQRLRDAIVQHPDVYDMDVMPPEQFRTGKFITVGLRTQIRQAQAAGYRIPVARTILITGLADDEIWVNMTRVSGVDSTRPESYTYGEIEGRKQIYEIARYLREFVPGFAGAHLEKIAPFMGIRESRVIVGKYVLTAEDILEDRRFDDAIAVAGYPVDIHHAKGGDCTLYWCDDCYDIPYRTLIPAHVGNLLVAGRCSSMNHEAMASTRVMSTCMALGEAAGRAARLALKAGVQPADLDVEALRAELRATGAYLG